MAVPLTPLRRTNLSSAPSGRESLPCVTAHLEKVVDAIIAANPEQVAKVKDKPQTLGWFVGQVMKESGGKANPKAVNDILKAKLGI